MYGSRSANGNNGSIVPATRVLFEERRQVCVCEDLRSPLPAPLVYGLAAALSERDANYAESAARRDDRTTGGPNAAEIVIKDRSFGNADDRREEINGKLLHGPNPLDDIELDHVDLGDL